MVTFRKNILFKYILRIPKSIFRWLPCIVVSMAACGGGGMSISEDTALEYCRSICDYAERCEPNNFIVGTLVCGEESKIEKTCMEHSSRIAPYLRQDFIEEYLSCREDDGCLDTPDEGTCLGRALEERNPPESLLERGRECEEIAKGCQDKGIDIGIGNDGCVYAYAMGTSTLVDALDRCLAKPCAEIDPCFQDFNEGAVSLFFD